MLSNKCFRRLPVKITKRILSASLFILFVLALFAYPASALAAVTANPAPWDGKTVASSYSAGDGTVANPYVIASAAEFAFFRDQVNALTPTLGNYYILAGDIDLGGNEWAPIGTSNDICFAGTFDGCGYTISNFKITVTSKVHSGLFGYTYSSYATIQNINIAKADITSSASGAYLGALVGYLQGGAHVTGVNVADSVTVSGVGGSNGGIAGRVVTNSTIEYCVSNATVIIDGANAYIGGITGVAGNGGSVIYCVNNGSVTANRSSGTDTAFYAGGIVGCIGASSVGGTVDNCYNTGSVSSTLVAGGVVGLINTAGNVITNSYNLSTSIQGDATITGSIIGYIKNPVEVTGCMGKSITGYGLYGSNVVATQTNFSGFYEGSDKEILGKTSAIDEKITAELSRLAAIGYSSGTPAETTVATTTETAAPITTPVPTTMVAPVTDAVPATDTPSTTSAPLTTAETESIEGGCGSSTVLMIIPLLAVAAVSVRRQHKEV